MNTHAHVHGKYWANKRMSSITHAWIHMHTYTHGKYWAGSRDGHTLLIVPGTGQELCFILTLMSWNNKDKHCITALNYLSPVFFGSFLSLPLPTPVLCLSCGLWLYLCFSDCCSFLFLASLNIKLSTILFLYISRLQILELCYKSANLPLERDMKKLVKPHYTHTMFQASGGSTVNPSGHCSLFLEKHSDMWYLLDPMWMISFRKFTA